jgi:hypothetical protein
MLRNLQTPANPTLAKRLGQDRAEKQDRSFFITDEHRAFSPMQPLLLLHL